MVVNILPRIENMYLDYNIRKYFMIIIAFIKPTYIHLYTYRYIHLGKCRWKMIMIPGVLVSYIIAALWN